MGEHPDQGAASARALHTPPGSEAHIPRHQGPPLPQPEEDRGGRLRLQERIEEFLKEYLPEERCDVEYFDEKEDIFESYRIEIEIAKLPQKKIWLKSGGYIVFDYTEALTVIDVNTGKYLGKRGLEDTILRTNLEAVKEIAYQIRLRNMGGIIVVDFIDMERKESRETVFQALLDALKKDRIKTFAYPISELGLVQLTQEKDAGEHGHHADRILSHLRRIGLHQSRGTRSATRC